MKQFEIPGQVAVVTGAARGIGRATARLLAEAGASVALLDVDGDTAKKEAGRIGSKAAAWTCDVTSETAVESVFAEVIKRFGRIDVLVNNAGAAVRKPAVELSMEEWRRILDLNLGGVFLCSRIAARTMGAQGGGAIVNLASIMGFSGGIFPNASYQASKGGVVNLTRALALEWAEMKIRVNAVAPTFREDRPHRADLHEPGSARQSHGAHAAGRVARSRRHRRRHPVPGESRGALRYRRYPAGRLRLSRPLKLRADSYHGRFARGELHAVHVLVERQLQERVGLQVLRERVAEAGTEIPRAPARIFGLGLHP